MNDGWNSDDIDTAKAELLAAGWVAKTSTLWKAPSGALHLGPAGAWRVMKRGLNDEAAGILAQRHATFDSENAAAETRLRTRPKSSWEVRAEAAESHRDLLRAALVGVVGVDGRAELEQLEAVMRLMPAPAQDKAATIDAIHALIATVPAQASGAPPPTNAVDPVDGKG